MLDEVHDPVPLRSRSLDSHDILQRPPDVLDAPSQSASDPRSPLDEEPVVLNYGSGDAVIAVDNSREEGSAQDTPSAAEDAVIAEPDTGTPPQQASILDTPFPEPGASLEHATGGTADAPMVVHDSDPPFMTDGRGRVVWSSTTATRGRRRRTSTSISSAGPVQPPHRDSKPRDGPSSELRS